MLNWTTEQVAGIVTKTENGGTRTTLGVEAADEGNIKVVDFVDAAFLQVGDQSLTLLGNLGEPGSAIEKAKGMAEKLKDFYGDNYEGMRECIERFNNHEGDTLNEELIKGALIGTDYDHIDQPVMECERCGVIGLFDVLIWENPDELASLVPEGTPAIGVSSPSQDFGHGWGRLCWECVHEVEDEDED